MLLEGKIDDHIDYSEIRNLEIIEIGFKSSNFLYNALKASLLAKKLSSQSSQVIFHDTNGYFLPLFALKKSNKSKVFVTSFYNIGGWARLFVWNTFHFLQMLRFSKTRRVLFVQFLQKLLCVFADKIVLQAPDNTQLLQKGVKVRLEKIEILRNNFDHNFWKISSSDRQRISNEKIHLMYAGPICFFKGIYQMLGVCNKLKKHTANFKLTIIGDWFGTFDKESVLRMIENLELSNYIDFIPKIGKVELRSFYLKSDLLLYLSENEGSPRIVLEAMGCGLPVIASKHPGIVELDPKQQYINFTDYNDLSRIVTLILSYKKHPDIFIAKSENGRINIIDHFSTPVIASDYIQFYNNIISG